MVSLETPCFFDSSQHRSLGWAVDSASARISFLGSCWRERDNAIEQNTVYIERSRHLALFLRSTPNNNDLKEHKPTSPC